MVVKRIELERLLEPRAIAVIGATAKQGRVGRIIFETLLRSDRPVYPVHPKEDEVLGHRAYRTVEELPDGIDLAVIAINAEQTVDAAERCAKSGIPFLIPVAGGFSETGPAGKALEDRLRTLVRTYGTRILGPNTLGLFVPRERLDTIFVEHGDKALADGGGVAFISQSGSVGTEGLGVASNIGFGLRAFAGLGNAVDLDAIDFLRHFGADPETSCVALYLETLKEPRALLEVAREVARHKPIVALKAGRTPTGAAAASSHTGRLAGSDRVISGAFRQFGIQRVYDEEQLCDAARALSLAPLPKGPRVAIMSSGGGYGVMSTDYVETDERLTHLVMAELSPETKERIRQFTPSYASPRNPVDLTAVATDQMTIEALEALLDDPGVDVVLCITLFAPPGITDELVTRLPEVARRASKPVIVVAQYGPFTDGILRRLHEADLVGFPCVARAVRAIRFLVERAQLAEALGGEK